MFRLARGLRPLRHFLVATSLTLPNREDIAWITGALINRAVRRDDLAAATRTSPSTRSPRFNIDS